MGSKRASEPKASKAKRPRAEGPAFEDLYLADLVSGAAPKAEPEPAGARPRQAEPVALAEALVGYHAGAEEPTPIRLVACGKELVQGEVFETQSAEIRKEYPQSPVAKALRAKYNWVAQTEGGRFTRDPNKMLPLPRHGVKKWTCDVCGKTCSEQLFVFRAFLRKEHLRRDERFLDPFVAYISFKCGRGLLGQLSEYSRFKEEVYSLTSQHQDLEEARGQLEESLRRCNREDQQFLMDELERLAGVGPSGAPKTVEMDSVERLMSKGHPAVLLRSAEDVFRALARSLAPRVSSRLLAAATVAQGGDWSGYLQAVAASLRIGGPLPQAPGRWPYKEVEMCLEAVLRAVNKGGEAPQLRIQLACSWDARVKAFGPRKADLTLNLGYLQARQALHAFAGGQRLGRDKAQQLQMRLEKLAGDLQQPVQPEMARLPGSSLKPAPRYMGRAESLGYGWHSADWAQRLKELLSVQLDFTQRPLRLATGCSGAEAPHFALQQLVTEQGFEQLWGSEINENPRRFILKNCACQHLFEDVCHIMEGGGRCARHGGRCAVPAGEVDIFVGGFPCTPYSFCNPKRFKRNCFTDPAAVPFFEMRKFIAARRPRLVILENVRGLLAPNPETDHPPIDFILRGKNPESSEDCYQGTEPNADWGLSFIEGYGLRWDVLYSCDFGLPQSRPRVYIVMVREDAGGQAAAERIFQVLQACAGRLPRGSCNDFLFPEEDPRLQEAMGRWKGLPKRRACTKFTEALFRSKRLELGLDQKDRRYSGRRAAGWYPQATEKMVQQLDIIHAVAEKEGLDFNFLLADLSQQVSRGAWRDDGNIPTLTTGSLLYSFSRHRPFIGEECLRLNGFPIEQLALDAHSEAERIFLAGNAMSVPVVGAVLFASLVSLNWGEGRRVSVGELPSALQSRPDVRRLTQPGVVLAQMTALVDDEAEVLDATDSEASALARRAAVLVALAREWTATAGAARRQEGKELKEKKQGLVAVVASASVADEPSGEGDGTGWKERYEQVLKRLKGPKDEALLSTERLKKWVQEASSLLVGMCRDERHDSAHELQQFVVKSLQVLSTVDAVEKLGMEQTLLELTNLRFPEAKLLFGRLVVRKMQVNLSSEDLGPDDWLDQAPHLVGAELSSCRAVLLKTLNGSRHHQKLAKYLPPLLRLWRREGAEDQELQQVYKGMEILRKAWCHGAQWQGFLQVHALRQLCLEIAQSCESRRRPKSSQAFYELAGKWLEVLPQRAEKVLMKVEASEKGIGDWVDFMQDALRVEEKMGWGSSSVSSSWRLLQQIFEMLSMADVRAMDCWPLPVDLSAVAQLLGALRGQRQELAKALDQFFWRVVPNLGMRLHLEEMRRDPAGRPRYQASLEHFVHWAERTLSTRRFGMKGWSSTVELEKDFSQWSQELNLLLKSLDGSLGVMDPESQARCYQIHMDSKQLVQEHAEMQQVLARLSIVEQLLASNGLETFLQFPKFREGLLELAQNSCLDVESCFTRNGIKVPPEVIGIVVEALQEELVVEQWLAKTSRAGLRFFQYGAQMSWTSWTWPVNDLVQAMKSRAREVPGLAWASADPDTVVPGTMTPPEPDWEATPAFEAADMAAEVRGEATAGALPSESAGEMAPMTPSGPAPTTPRRPAEPEQPPKRPRSPDAAPRQPRSPEQGPKAPAWEACQVPRASEANWPRPETTPRLPAEPEQPPKRAKSPDEAPRQPRSPEQGPKACKVPRAFQGDVWPRPRRLLPPPDQELSPRTPEVVPRLVPAPPSEPPPSYLLRRGC